MPRVEHFAIFAHDLEPLRAFYQDAFQMKVIVDNSKAPTRGYFLADEAGSLLEIIERPDEAQGAETRYLFHLAFAVDDFDDTRTRLERQGVRFETDSEVHADSWRTAFFNDPEGNRCQIVWRREPLIA